MKYLELMSAINNSDFEDKEKEMDLKRLQELFDSSMKIGKLMFQWSYVLLFPENRDSLEGETDHAVSEAAKCINEAVDVGKKYGIELGFDKVNENTPKQDILIIMNEIFQTII